MERQILHCDMNNFFASVEISEKPEIRNKPVAVCGDREKRHGIVLAKNEIAKKYGVSTGEPIFRALEKIPELVIVPPHYEKYVAVSKIFRKILCEYTDLVEPFGIDECWMDVSGSARLFGSAVSIANSVRERIKKEINLTCSVGVSYNKVFAKLGSDMKKPDATSIISKEDFKEKIWHLPAGDLFGVGIKTASDLYSFGIKTIGDLANAKDGFLQLRYGKCGKYIKDYANGCDFSPVQPCNYEFPIKSIGHGVTTSRDLVSSGEVWRVITELSQDVGEKLRFHQKVAKGVSIAVKDKNFYRKEIQTKLPFPTNSNAVLSKAFYSLFLQRYEFSQPIRSITVRAIDLEDISSGFQLSFFDAENIRNEKIDFLFDNLRAKYGKNALFIGTLLTPPIYDETNKTKISTLP